MRLPPPYRILAILAYGGIFSNTLIIKDMTLHEAMACVLKQNSRPMKAAEIAEEVNRMGLYTRGDGNPVPSSQISARAKTYPQYFERKEGYICLI